MSLTTKEEMVEELLGKVYDESEVPTYPARIFWRDGDFFTDFPHAPVRFVEVRFREAWATEDGDFTVQEARWIDTSNPEDSHGDWEQYHGHGQKS